MLVVAPFEIIGPVIAKRELGGAFAWGVTLTGFSVGTLLGGRVMLRVKLRRPMSVAGLLFFVTCAAPLLLELPGPVWSITLAYVGEGFAVGIFVTSWETALQNHIPKEMMARVGAWDWLGTIDGMPIGFALTGPVVDAIGTSATLGRVRLGRRAVVRLPALELPASFAFRRNSFCKAAWSSRRIACIVTISWRSLSPTQNDCDARGGATPRRSGS